MSKSQVERNILVKLLRFGLLIKSGEAETMKDEWIYFWGGFFIGVILSVFAYNVFTPDFTIQDVCLECHKVYGSSDGYCVDRLILPSKAYTDAFCKNKGFDWGITDGLTCDRGIKCFKSNKDIIEIHCYRFDGVLNIQIDEEEKP